MADSLPHTHHVLKIGFLNHDVRLKLYFQLDSYYHQVFVSCVQVDDLLKLYMDIYDIVLTGDCDMTVVNAVVQTVLHAWP